MNLLREIFDENVLKTSGSDLKAVGIKNNSHDNNLDTYWQTTAYALYYLFLLDTAVTSLIIIPILVTQHVPSPAKYI